MSVQTPALRLLVACSACARQYDATGFATGSRFHCACGETLTVPVLRPHEAAVVRCSACGAPRAAPARSCAHCGADYTLHEQDLSTVCPSCMARVSSAARFCHHCATPIVPQGRVGDPTRLLCPACGAGHRLHSRSLGEPPISMLECRRCAGLWLGQEAFDLLADRARASARADRPAPATQRADAPSSASAQACVPYRKCPVCRKHMNRRNFARHSGVVLDHCRSHGSWFDAHELDQILTWIRGGGEGRAAERDRAESRHGERQQLLQIERSERNAGVGPRWGAEAARSEPGLLEGLLGFLLDF